MKLHREGNTILMIVSSLLIIINIIAYIYLKEYEIWLGIVAILSAGIFLLFAQFFRIPNRIPTVMEKGIIAPADGKVVIIEKVFEKEYLKTDCIQVSIFMSPLNVHQNKIPIEGEIEYYKYHPGLYMVAWHPKSSELNERNTTVIRTNDGQKILMRQIAGAVAKRICYYLREGQKVSQNQELGFIKFGSRVDLYLPLDADIKVSIGDITKNSQTLIAMLR